MKGTLVCILGVFNISSLFPPILVYKGTDSVNGTFQLVVKHTEKLPLCKLVMKTRSS